MKTVLALFLMSGFFAGDVALAISSENLQFIPMKRFEQTDGLPPKLIAVFDIDCNQRFIKTVRHDLEGPGKSPVMHIFVGALVSESMLSSCAGMIKEHKAEAGTTFSGREFEVHSIAQGTAPAPPRVVSTGIPTKGKIQEKKKPQK